MDGQAGILLDSEDRPFLRARTLNPAQAGVVVKPKIFIASSAEGLRVARAVQDNLEYDAFNTLWTQGVFRPSEDGLDNLLRELQQSDFGIFVFTPDDVLNLRGDEFRVPRDNVVFELGMFIGRLGKRRCFVLIPRGFPDLHLPSDLLGLTPTTYDPKRLENNEVAAVGNVCNEIRRIIEQLGPIEKTTEFVTAADPKLVEIGAVERCANTIAKSYGPNGVGIPVLREFGSEVTSRRGSFIAMGFAARDASEIRGIKIVDRTVSEIAQVVGDGTKLAVLLLYQILRHAYKTVEAGMLLTDVCDGISAATERAVEHLRNLSVHDNARLQDIAATASGSADVAKLVVHAIEQAGADGMISIEWYSGYETQLQITDGAQFDRGYIKPDFVTDPAIDSVILEDCYILLYTGKLSFLTPSFIRLLGSVAQTRRPLLIVAEQVDSQALATFRENHIR